MNSNFYPNPNFVPNESVITYQFLNSPKRVPIVANVEAVVWDESAQSWRYYLSGIGYRVLEKELASYSKGIFITKAG